MHVDIALTLKDLARAIDRGGDQNGAIPVMRSAVAMQRQLRGSEPHPAVAEAINDLALLLEAHGDYEEAEALYRESIAMKRRLLGDKHPEIALGLNNLAVMYQDKGDLVHAESTYREALAMQRELLGATHPDVAQTLNNLAFVQYDRGDTAGALATKREALAVYRRVFPKDHPDVARVMNQIGFWLTQAGQYAEADHDLQEALAMRRRLFGNSHPDVATSLVHVAILQVARREYDEALVSARDAVAILAAACRRRTGRRRSARASKAPRSPAWAGTPRPSHCLTHGLGILSKDGGAPPAYHDLAQRYLDRLHAEAGRPGGGRQSYAVATTGPDLVRQAVRRLRRTPAAWTEFKLNARRSGGAAAGKSRARALRHGSVRALRTTTFRAAAQIAPEREVTARHRDSLRTENNSTAHDASPGNGGGIDALSDLNVEWGDPPWRASPGGSAAGNGRPGRDVTGDRGELRRQSDL